MSSEHSNLRIVAYGVLVGLGMVMVAIAVFTRLPIGKEFIGVLRGDSKDRSEARVETVPTPVAIESADSTQDSSSNSVQQESQDQVDEELPGQIAITKKVEVTMGMSRLTFEVGEMLTVTGRKNGLFLCDYLGDTVGIPIDATNRAESGQTAP